MDNTNDKRRNHDLFMKRNYASAHRFIQLRDGILNKKMFSIFPLKYEKANPPFASFIAVALAYLGTAEHTNSDKGCPIQ